jgi:hypothetical protein
VRLASKSKEAAAVCEVFGADVLQRRTELGTGGIHRLRIGRINFYEKIEIVGKAWLRVKDDSVASHNEVLNAMGMEGGQKVFVILEHPAPSPNL